MQSKTRIELEHNYSFVYNIFGLLVIRTSRTIIAREILYITIPLIATIRECMTLKLAFFII